MRTYLFPLASFVLFILVVSSSCTKSNSHGGNPGQSDLSSRDRMETIISYDTANGNVVDSVFGQYMYDSSGRVASAIVYTQLQNSTGQINEIGFDTMQYVYNPSVCTLTENLGFQTSSHPLQETKVSNYYLNAAGTQPDSMVTTIHANGQLIPVSTLAQFSFDANGYLNQEKTFLRINGSTTLENTTNYTVTNGNTISTTTLTATGAVGQVQTNTFSGSVSPGAAYVNSMRLSLTGKVDVDLLQSTSIDNYAAGYSVSYSDSYTFDSQGRIAQVLTRTASGRLSTKITYGY